MHGENEFLMLDGVLVSITSHGKREREKERERIPTPDRKIRVCRAGLKKSLLGLEMWRKF